MLHVMASISQSEILARKNVGCFVGLRGVVGLSSREMETSLSPDQLPKLGRPTRRSAGKSKRYRIDLGSTEWAKDE